MVQFLVDHVNSGSLPETKNEYNVVDLGTGNGHLLFQLHEDLAEEVETETAFNFHGIDYLPESVAFAVDIHRQKYPETAFSFEQVDLLEKNSAYLTKNAGFFDILLDKGTLDAIALNNEPLADFGGKIGMEIYASQVSQLMHKSSVLLITSCNFTEEELVSVITENGQNGLKVWDRINYPSFRFGGVQGSTICSVAFVREK